MTNKVAISTKHSDLGPSSSKRWLNCPGSVLLIRKLLQQGMKKLSSIYAAEGNAAHELSEWCRINKVSAEEYRGTVIQVGEFEFTIDQEFIDNVDEFVDYVNALPGQPLYEEMVDYEDWVKGGFGTLDDGRIIDGVCYVTDLKYGKGVQEFAEGNPQLLLYALGLYNEFKHLYVFDKFVLTIHQPRLEHVDTVEVTLDELLKWADQKVRPIAEIALKPGAPFAAGDHCFFCPARREGCKVYDTYVTEPVYDEFEALDVKSEPVEVDFLSLDDLAIRLPKVPAVKKWCGDLTARARSELAQGHEIVHPVTGAYKMVEGRSNRAWRDADRALAALEFEFGENTGFINAKGELLSPAAIEKIVGKKALAELDLVVKPPGSPVLVAGTDKRESLKLNAEDEFEVVENEDE